MRLGRQDKNLVRLGYVAHTYPLSPLLRCVTCGARLRGHRSNGRYRYWHDQHSHGWAQVDAEALEQELLARFTGWTLPASLAEEIMRQARAEQDGKTGDDVAQQIRRLESQLEREKDLYSLGDGSRDEYLRKRKEIEAEITRISPRDTSTQDQWQHLATIVGNFQAIITGDGSEDSRRLQKSLLATIVESIDTDGQKITALNLRPWFDAFFKAVINVYPQPDSNRRSSP